jgi:peptidoglycan/xylan/chitin deacetylase (PgdA/CDA1 family)
MPAFKDLFFNFSTPFTYISGVRRLRKASRRSLLLPLYHTISDSIPAHLSYLYPVRRIDEFRQDLESLLKLYRPVSMEDLIALSRNGLQPAKPSFHLTFDDGLSEFHSIVAPILLEKGIPATCFLNNSFIGNKSMMFRLKASLLIDHLHAQPAGAEGWKIFHDWLTDRKTENVYYRKLLLKLRYSDGELLDKLASRLGLEFADYLSNVKPYLAEEQIFELIGKGFTFGAHTREHPDFRDMSEKECVDEVKASVDDICATFKLSYRVFSFPFSDIGLSSSFFNKLRTGNICDITFGSAGIKQDSAQHNLQRFPVECYKGSLESMLKKEYLYQVLLNMSGKSVIMR